MNARKARRSPPVVDRRAQGIRGGLLLAALLVAGTLLVYSQVWDFGFIAVDDPAYVPGNPHVQVGITLNSVIWSVTAVHDCNWIPFTWLSLMLDTDIYGGRAGGYHLTNVLLHAASTVVLFAALALATDHRARSAFVAALFALHPLHVESVAWIAERKDVLSTLFGLLSLLAYVRYATAARWRDYAASFVLFLCSLLSKPALVTLPFVYLLLDFWPLGRLVLANESRRRAWPLIAEKTPFFVASAAFSAIALATQSSGGAMAVRFPLVTRIGNALVVYVAYLGKAVYPQNLAFYYPHPAIRISWLLVGCSACLLVAISAATLMWLRRYPFLFVGWFWYLGTLVPTIGLVQIGIQQMADRYTYFPLIGIFIAFAWIGPELAPAGVFRSRVLPLTAVSIVLLLAATTFIQIGYWHDSVTLLRHSMDCTPESSHSHELLGAALIADGAVSDGVDELQNAVKQAAPYAPLRYELAGGFERLGRLDDAAKQYEAALAIDERLPQAHDRLGVILTDRRQFESAKRHLDRALELDEKSAVTHANLALFYLKTDDYAGTIVQAKRALELDPDLSVCHQYLGQALRGQGRIDEAIGQFQRYLASSPDDQTARDELAQTLAMKRTGGGKTTGP